MDRLKTRYFTTKVGAGSIHKKPSFFSECVTETVYGDSNKILPESLGALIHKTPERLDLG